MTNSSGIIKDILILTSNFNIKLQKFRLHWQTACLNAFIYYFVLRRILLAIIELLLKDLLNQN